MMHVVIATDSFKGTLTSREAGEIMRQGVMKNYPDAMIDVVPLADGGEGTVDAVMDASLDDTKLITGTYRGPLGQSISASMALLGRSETAVLEMAATSGLGLLDPEDRDPCSASTFGTGQQIVDALDKGVSKILIGIGGSATNDGGMGMAQALGVRFYDQSGKLIERKGCGSLLPEVSHLNMDHLHSCLADVEIEVLCDVDNPLCGPRGATFVYGPQKASPDHVLTPDLLKTLDDGMKQYAGVIARNLGVDMISQPGAGAAGGLGGAFLAFTKARLCRGIDAILDLIGFDDHICKADLVITGEGRLDAQSNMGKAISGIARRAKLVQTKVIAIVGCQDEGSQQSLDCLDACYGPTASTELSMNPDAVRQRLLEQTIDAMNSLSD